MFLAKLFSESNSGSIAGSQYAVNKYKNLIKWRDNLSIFEFGTGDGKNTEKTLLPILPDHINKLVGSDRSPEMIEYARNNKTLIDKGMTFRTFDLNTDVVPQDLTGGFDNVFSFYTLYWIQNTDRAMRNVFKLLKYGGQLFSVTLAESPLDETHDKLSKDPKWSKYGNQEWISPYYKDKYTIDTYKLKLQDAGFVDVTVKSDVYVHKFYEEEFIKLMTTVNPSIAKVPSHEMDQYIEEYFNRLKNSKYVTYETDPNGKTIVYCQNDLLILYAMKPSE